MPPAPPSDHVNVIGDSWQGAVLPLIEITCRVARRTARRHGLRPGEHEEVVAESLLALCLDVRSAWLRGVAFVRVRYAAGRGLTAWYRSRLKVPERSIHDFDRPEDLFAAPEEGELAGGLGRAEEAQAELDTIARRLEDDRLARILRLRAEGLTLRQIGDRLGMSAQRVRQILDSIPARLERLDAQEAREREASRHRAEEWARICDEAQAERVAEAEREEGARQRASKASKATQPPASRPQTPWLPLGSAEALARLERVRTRERPAKGR